jgi:signal peptidase
MVFAVLFILLAVHTVFVSTETLSFLFYMRVLRPLLYVGLLAVVFMAGGRSEQTVCKGRHASLTVGLGIAVYFTAFFLIGFFNGFAHNFMFANQKLWVSNIFIYGSFVVFSEVLRYKMVKGHAVRKNILALIIITAVYSFVQINNFGGASNFMDFFFSVLMPVITLNAVLTYIAVDGTLPALLMLRGVYSLTPVLMPFLPNFDEKLWAVVEQASLFPLIFIYRFLMPAEKNKRRELTLPFWKRHAGGFVFAVIIILFNVGVFPIFPSIILTDSMAGVLDRGSVSFFRKPDKKNPSGSIQEGDIIQYRTRNNNLVVHRVIEIYKGPLGESYYITKGDNNDLPDSQPVQPEQVTGVVFGNIPYIGNPRVLMDRLFR